ncbi:hypothetical protein Q8F55_005915 [Vanrija albida]|uniref:Uncharacterized protein n=1 Tax=Vanrija albida TaxID=181172 RepID=A0ABR3Q2Y4_9TREE
MAHAATVITAATLSASPPTAFRRSSTPGPTGRAKRPLRVSYGATTTVPAVQVRGVSPEGANGHMGVEAECDDGDDVDDLDDYDLIEDGAPIINVTWRFISRLYLLVPIVTILFLALLVVIIVYGWPPSADERSHGQVYPHPIFWKAFLVGLFASFTVQSLRVPTWVGVSWLLLSNSWTIVLSTVVHAILHEGIRLVSIPLTIPSPTSGFHSSYYLGLGWGVAEAAWGIVQGWEQLELYRDLLEPERWDEEAALTEEPDEINGHNGLATVPETESLLVAAEEEAYLEDEAELALRVEVLERMRARQELEDAFGLPFPNIPFPLHLLWRLDTLLLNLGLTLILSAYYFDSEPIYKHQSLAGGGKDWEPAEPNPTPSPYLPLVWVLVTLLHIALSLVWKIVGSAGVGAVTWGGLIVALGTVFAGLGAWGGVV